MFQLALDVNASGGRYISYFIPVNVTITETITELIVSEKIDVFLRHTYFFHPPYINKYNKGFYTLTPPCILR